MDDAALMDNGLSLMDDGSLMMDNGLPGTSYVSPMKFLAGACVFQENTPARELKLPNSNFRWLGIFKRRRCGN